MRLLKQRWAAVTEQAAVRTDAAERKSQNHQEMDGDGGKYGRGEDEKLGDGGKGGRSEDEKEGDGGNDGRGEDARRREDACLRERKEPEQKRHRDSERHGHAGPMPWRGSALGP